MFTIPDEVAGIINFIKSGKAAIAVYTSAVAVAIVINIVGDVAIYPVEGCQPLQNFSVLD